MIPAIPPSSGATDSALETSDIQAVVLDFDNTLVDTFEPQVAGHVAAVRFAVTSGVPLAGDIARVAGEQAELARAVRALFRLHRDPQELLERIFPGQTGHYADIQRERRRARHAATLRIPDEGEVWPAIATLAQHYPLAIVTATSVTTVREYLQGLPGDPSRHFSHVLGAEGSDTRLPCTEKADHLRTVADRFGLPPRCVAFVGDTREDYESARNAGMAFVECRMWTHRYGVASLVNEDGIPSFKSYSSGELQRILRRLDRGGSQ